MTGGSSTSVVREQRGPVPAPLPVQPVLRPLTDGSVNPLRDDRDHITAGDRVLLIIEDDVSFAKILLETARRQGFKCILAMQGDHALEMARRYKPHAITLDLQLPVVDGWTVLDQLKRDPQTRHIPIQVVSVLDRGRSALVGAISYLEKPVSREAIEGALVHMKSFVERDVRELLIVEDDPAQRQSLNSLLGDMDVAITEVGTGEEALKLLKTRSFDCMILDLGLPDMAGFDLLKKIKRQAKLRDLPVVIYTGKDLSKQEEGQLKKYASAILTKGGTGTDQLVEETSMFLHRVAKSGTNGSAPHSKEKAGGASAKAATAAPQESMLRDSTPPEADSRPGRAKVLIVDDDMRNIFALTSALENNGVEVVYAENGRDGIETLQSTPGIDVVLMDVMMPEMDGYETTRAIRALGQYNDLPIISLTAKAMAGDREKCLEAGADDYITKPVDIDTLLTMIAKWSGRALDGGS
jgi:CheY-like chemotaxis protein